MKKTIHSLLAAALLWGACATAGKKNSHDMAVNRNLTTFNAMVKALDENYVDSVRTDEAFKAAIAALLGTVDPYTEYYTADETENLRNMTTGEYAGIGSIILVRDGITYISEPLEGSPAYRAGLRAGDKILSVDTVNTLEPKNQNVSKLLRGQAGTQVAITVARPYPEEGTDTVRTYTVTREKVQQPSVPYYGRINGGRTGYVRLTSFIDKSPAEMREALKSFAEGTPVEGVILDLRGNGGGLVESAVEILGDFLPKGTEVLRTRGRDTSLEKTYRTSRKPLMPDVPLVVLIDGGSASASEITAGAIQDLDRGVLVGSRSFGKGLVQGTLPMPYDGLLKVTMAKYYIPSGRLIQALDYSRRNPDGTVAYTPDSLTSVYHTRAGREVRDGGGLQPDTTLTWASPSALLIKLMRDNKIFDFATRFVASHPENPDGEEIITVTDGIYGDFTASLDTVGFDYERRCATLLGHLRDAIREEGYLNDEATAEMDRLEELLKHDLQRDLELKRPEISQYIAEELMTRYGFEKGRIRTELQNDPGITAALEILGDPARYASMLGKPKRK
ncbi:MAG: S41 family peptidase [Muribaculaceae bacterium]|nr:S41 family peptidase [Muribaculaceae bacterium]